MEKLKQIQNLFKKHIRDIKSIVYAADRILKLYSLKVENRCTKRTEYFINFTSN